VCGRDYTTQGVADRQAADDEFFRANRPIFCR